MSAENAKPRLKDDPIWEAVLENLAQQGYLARFYKIPRHEMAAMSKLYRGKAVQDLARLFSLSQNHAFDARDELIAKTADPIRYVMLHMLVRAMKCWVETETPNLTGTRLPWKVAHS